MNGNAQVDSTTQTRKFITESDREEAPPDKIIADEAMRYVQDRKDRFEVMKSANDVQNRRSLEEVEFNSGKHWDDGMRKERDDKDMVVIEVNRTPQYLNQVANEQRMTRPSILIRPNGNGASEEVAEVYQGLVRSIERRSGTESIRDDKFYSMLEKGWAYYRVVVEWESERSFRQVIRTKNIFNDFAVYCDPAATEYDRSDAEDWIITDDMPIQTYKQKYKGSRLASLDTFEGLGDMQREWIGKDTIRVAECFHKDRGLEKLYVLADDINADGKFEDELEVGEGGKLVGVAYVGDTPLFRLSWRTRVMWSTINAIEVLEGNDDLTGPREYLPPVNGRHLQFIPIISLQGRRILREGRYIWTGMVRDAMEPCLASDYWLSAITGLVALAPKAPWVAVYDAIAQYREMWDQSNIENYAALYYDKYDDEGNELPAPMRAFGEPPIQAMTFILNYAEEDLKRVMGIYNRSLGQSGPEHSGVAIKAVQNEADVANFNYIDNLKRTEEYEGKVYVDMAPLVYTAGQVVDIVKPDKKSEKVVIGQQFTDKNGKKVNTDISAGTYDIDIEVGPSASTKRQEAAEGILQYLKIDPAAAPLVGYLLARNMDFPDKDELEQNLRSRVPPGVLQEKDSDVDMSDVPPQFKQQYDAQAKQLEQMTQVLQQVQQKVDTEELKFQHELMMKSLELASNERIAKAKADSDIVRAEMAAKSKADLAMINVALERAQRDIDMLRGQQQAAQQPPAAAADSAPTGAQPAAEPDGQQQ